MASQAPVLACRRLETGGAVIPGYLQDALLRRRSVARVNRTPLPVVVLNPDFFRAIVLSDDTRGNVVAATPESVTLFGMRVREDATVPFGEWWYE